jgi:acyl carrier protein
MGKMNLEEMKDLVLKYVILENNFKIKIPPSNAIIQAFDSINRIVALVKQYIN